MRNDTTPAIRCLVVQDKIPLRSVMGSSEAGASFEGGGGGAT